MTWRKSSHCGESTCVGVAHAPGLVGVRDSKDPDSPILRFTPAEWTAFLTGVKAGEFDLPKE